MPSIVCVRTVLKKSLCHGPREAGGFAIVERSEDFILLRGAELDEGLLVRLLAVRVELSQSVAVEFL